jgi:hypothetical protein
MAGRTLLGNQTGRTGRESDQERDTLVSCQPFSELIHMFAEEM